MTRRNFFGWKRNGNTLSQGLSHTSFWALVLVFSLSACREGGSGVGTPGPTPDWVKWEAASKQSGLVGNTVRYVEAVDLPGVSFPVVYISGSSGLIGLEWRDGQDGPSWTSVNTDTGGYSLGRMNFYLEEVSENEFQPRIVLVQRVSHAIRFFERSTQTGNLTEILQSAITTGNLERRDVNVANNRSLLDMRASAPHQTWALNGTPVSGGLSPTTPTAGVRALVGNFRNKREDPDDPQSPFLDDFIAVGGSTVAFYRQTEAENFLIQSSEIQIADTLIRDALFMDLEASGKEGLLLATEQGFRFYRNTSETNLVRFQEQQLTGASHDFSELKRIRAIQANPGEIPDVMALFNDGSWRYFRTTQPRSFVDVTNTVWSNQSSVFPNDQVIDFVPFFMSSSDRHDLAFVDTEGNIAVYINEAETPADDDDDEDDED